MLRRLILKGRKRFLAKAAATIAALYLLILIIEVKFIQKTLYPPTFKYYSLKSKSEPYVIPSLDKEDYNKLINLIDFNFIIVNNCTNDIFLAVVVTSAPKNIDRRNTIRATWGKNDAKVKTFFMLGAVDSTANQQAIVKESKQYGDIIQGNFLDSYYNLTYKTVMALKFITYHCPNVTYIVKADDDIFVNTPLLKVFLTNDLSPFGALNLLMCLKIENALIIRSQSKWAVTEEEFSGKYYPTYCKGPHAIFSPDVLFKLYIETQKQKYFHIEDVFLYGLTVSKVPEIKHTDITDYTLWNYGIPIFYKIARNKRNFLFGVLEMDVNQVKEAWEFVNQGPVRSSVYD